MDETPHAFKTEQEVLATVLLAPEVLTRLSASLTCDDFYVPQHRSLWSVMLESQSRHGAVDLVLLSQTGRDMGK